MKRDADLSSQHNIPHTSKVYLRTEKIKPAFEMSFYVRSQGPTCPQEWTTRRIQ